mmetsp:Transcript_79189/g.220148  ORF Transcript_79189/g.220148 Transcript_79189/m.220148 type:complete len:203 (-) Transcript_79189:53-661(-)
MLEPRHWNVPVPPPSGGLRVVPRRAEAVRWQTLECPHQSAHACARRRRPKRPLRHHELKFSRRGRHQPWAWLHRPLRRGRWGRFTFDEHAQQPRRTFPQPAQQRHHRGVNAGGGAPPTGPRTCRACERGRVGPRRLPEPYSDRDWRRRQCCGGSRCTESWRRRTPRIAPQTRLTKRPLAVLYRRTTSCSPKPSSTTFSIWVP